MRKISVEMIEPGMVLAKAVYGDTGQTLLRADVEIKAQYIDYLKRVSVEYVYIRDSRIEDVNVEDPVSEETRHEARQMVKNLVSDLQSTDREELSRKSLNIHDREIFDTVNKIIDELLLNKDVVTQLIDFRTKDDYLFAHSINSTILATLVAIKMRYKYKELKWLALGTMFHDIGMAVLPDEIMNKSEALTKEEYEIVTEHPQYGYDIFKKFDIFDARAGAVILQHHERFQGQGYPRGMKGDRIYPLAQIAAIADVYDALTSDRPHRPAFQPHQAIEMLMSWGEELFEINILRSFLSIVAAYPIGSHVMLSNGDSGLVVANNPGFTLWPVVRLLYVGENLAPHPAPYDLDLSKTHYLTIVRVIE